MPSCAAPAGGLSDCGSDEDAITKEMVLSGGLSPCASDLRERLFSWAEMMEQKQYLCRGCYDPYCDEDSKNAVRAMDCGMDTEAHNGGGAMDWSAGVSRPIEGRTPTMATLTLPTDRTAMWACQSR